MLYIIFPTSRTEVISWIYVLFVWRFSNKRFLKKIIIEELYYLIFFQKKWVLKFFPKSFLTIHLENCEKILGMSCVEQKYYNLLSKIVYLFYFMLRVLWVRPSQDWIFSQVPNGRSNGTQRHPRQATMTYHCGCKFSHEIQLKNNQQKMDINQYLLLIYE